MMEPHTCRRPLMALALLTLATSLAVATTLETAESLVDVTAQLSSRNTDRKLLIVSKNATDQPAVKTASQGKAKVTGKPAAKKPAANPLDGVTSSSAGADIVVLDDRPQNGAIKTAAPGGNKTENGNKPTASDKRAARQQARSSAAVKRQQLKRRQQQQQQATATNTLGRKGGPGQPSTARQTVDADADFSYDTVLPFCQPSEGVVCADNDLFSFLQSEPGEIVFDGYSYAQAKPASELAVEDTLTVDAVADTVSSATTGTIVTSLESNLGNNALNTETEVSHTFEGTTIDGSRFDRIAPDQITVDADATDITGVYNSQTLRPRYTYVIGQNFGLPVGLATVADGGE